ncbi:MAG: hypothetical protein LBE36_06405 [Flavobacteriaceae bacterium]|jgi:hypothetical protein|nr:hypothetical protein [Flavobacteriaceae bacterium]
MTAEEKHKQNIELYLKNGGSERISKQYEVPSLANRAKISFLISNLKPKISSPLSPEGGKDGKTETPIIRNFPPSGDRGRLGLIANYPVELHSSYNEAISLWLNLCSLKIKLNEIHSEDETAAYDIQTEMLGKLQKFERMRKSLDHYNETKRILPTESKADFSKLSELELDKERRNLASLICKRKKTIAKMESDLPEKSASNYQKKISSLNRKKEQLEELILNEEKIKDLMM